MEGATLGGYVNMQSAGAMNTMNTMTQTSLGVGQGQVQTPQTLASAVSSFDSLHSRLTELTAKTQQLAMLIGGPFPVGGDEKQAGGQPVQDYAVRHLNDTANNCHRQATYLNECLDAMARSLGA